MKGHLNYKSILYLLSFVLVLLFEPQCNQPESVPEKNNEKPVSTTNQRKEPQLIYDTKGNITERHSISYRSDNTVRSQDDYYYKYDEKNNLIEETKESYNPQGELLYKNVNYFTYNEANQKTEQKFISFNKDNQVQQQAKNTFRYDAKGQVVEEKSYYQDGRVKSIIKTERTDDGGPKSEEYINFDKEGKKTSHKKFHYSKSGLERTEDLLNK